MQTRRPSLLFALVLLASPLACATTCPGNIMEDAPQTLLPSEAERGGELRLALRSGSRDHNPIRSSGADTQAISHYVKGALAVRDTQDPSLWRPQLATCVTERVGDDGRWILTATLREDVLWHPIQEDANPRPWMEGEHIVTAEDFALTYTLIMQPEVEGAAALRIYMEELEAVEVVDAHTVRFIWSKPSVAARTMTMTWWPTASWLYTRDDAGEPVPEDALGAHFNSHPYRHMMGSGPYRFHSFDPGDAVRLERNPDYHGEAPAFDVITFTVVPNPDQQLALLEAGELDVISLSTAQYRSARERARYVAPASDGAVPADRYALGTYPQMVYRYIGWNQDGPFFGAQGQSAEDARKVRLAMTHALNRERTLSEHLEGLGQITTGNSYPLSPEYDASIPPWPYDLTRAAALLDEAGWEDTDGDGVRDKNGEPFAFTFLTYSYRPAYVALAEDFAEDLKSIGVSMSIEPVDWATMQTKLASGDFHAYIGGWGLAWDSDPYQIWHSSQADIPESSNRVGFRNERADAIIEEAQSSLDSKQRVKLFHELHAILHDEQPYTFLFTQQSGVAWQPHMRNMVFQKVRPHDLALPWYRVDAD